MENTQLEHKMNQMIRHGYVTARDEAKHRVQVQLKDTVNAALTTKFLPVLVPRASANLDYDLPDVGDEVVVLFAANGLEQGYVLGAIYGKQQPPVASGDKTHRKFKDGTTLEYDRGAHKLDYEVKGDVNIHATGSMTLKADGGFIIQGATINLN